MSHPLSYFERLYIVNLPTRADRRREMDAQLKAIGLALNHPLVELFAAVRPDAPGGFPSIGARGCFLSHLQVLRRARDGDLNRVLIVEDDLNFAPDFNRRMPDIAARLAGGEWSVFYGGYVLEPPPEEARSADGLLALSPEVPVQTSHFVAFNGPHVINAAIACLEAMLTRPPGHPEGGPMHVDGAYCWFRKGNPHWRTLLAAPVLGYQRSSRTDIHDLRWFDRMPVARNAVAWLRQWKNP